ncbi:hypothetical protein E4U53_007221 [Claviceps sorghi]|nr:hypothetical protein E4U53_007221 [Claviceps sorghi]
MIPRSAQLSRMCLACRLGMPPRPIAFPAGFPSSLSRRPQRRLASDFSVQSKERIEALISGALDESSFKPKGKDATKRHPRRGPKGRPRGKVVRHWAQGDIAPARRDTQVGQLIDDAGHGHDFASAHMEKEVLPEMAQEGDEPASLHPGREKNLRGRTRRHDLLQRQSLGVNALGKPVEAIILTNPNRLKRTRKPRPLIEDEPAGPALPLTLESVFPQYTDYSDEVLENIEEIRPKDTTVVRRKDFDKLMKRLVDGFTHEQLATYFSNGTWNGARNVDNKPSYPWILEQSPWTAAEAEQNPWENLTPKERRAMLILSAKWKLEIQEHIEGLGGMVLWLKPHVFKLITHSSTGLIQRLSNDFLNRSKNERISTHLEECRLGIYTGKPNVTTILSRLDEVVQTIKSQTVSVEQIDSENLTEPVLDELGSITKTTLHYHAKSATLTVSWLAESAPSPGQVEGPADIVLRLLLGRATVPDTTRLHVVSGTTPSKSNAGHFLIYQREKRGMSWRDKLRQWYRYVDPLGKAVDTVKPTVDLADKIALPKRKAGRSSDERTEVVATFGHVLHTKPSIRSASSGSSSSSSARRVLSTCIPHPAALTLVTADAQVPSTRKTAIVLHFAPDMTTASSSASARRGAFPLVRLHIPVNPSDDLSNFSFPEAAVLEATIPQHQADILLPGESVDVRLTQTRLLPLNSKSQPSLQDFLHASQFNLLQGQLHTPSRTTFSIPNHWSSPSSSSSSPRRKQDKTSTTNTPYLFTGLEIHQTIAVEWHGHTLQYSSIEAGHHAGQQQKLSLIAGAPHDTPDPMAKPLTGDQLATFLTLVGETASGVHFPWDHGYKLMHETPHGRPTRDPPVEQAQAEPSTQ